MSALAVYEVGGGYILARERTAGQFEAPMSREARETTGARATFGRSPDACVSGAVTVYPTLGAAKAALAAMDLDG